MKVYVVYIKEKIHSLSLQRNLFAASTKAVAIDYIKQYENYMKRASCPISLNNLYIDEFDVDGEFTR